MDQTIIQAGLVSAEAAINKALHFDPATAAKLQALSPKVLALEFEKPGFSVYVRFLDGIQLMSHFEGQPDASLKGPVSAFLNLASNQDKQAALMQSDIQIQGSSQLALSLADVMSHLDIDFEAMIAELAGPVAAHIIGKNFRSAASWFKNTGRKLKQDSVEFVRDELQLTPHSLEGESRFSDIQKIKMDTERLEARINRLKQLLK
ncbi:MAG: ubiquinone biosynthesis protein UbiJ [Psychrobacter glaciei]